MTNKPPLGACPAGIRARERIKELAEAIVRNAYDGPDFKIKDWAIEIIEQIGIAENHKTIEIRGLHHVSPEDDDNDV